MSQIVGAPPTTPGNAPAGVSPVAPYSTAPALTTVPEVQYVAQNYDYNDASADPIEVDVALSLGIVQGSCKHAKDLGHRLHEINPLGGPDEEQKAREYVMESNPIARRLKAGDIRIKSVTTDTSSGQMRAIVVWNNLRRDPNKDLTTSST